VDPWYDYLALPVAPALLIAQFGTTFLRWPWRQRSSVAAVMLLGAMTIFAWVVPTNDPGANIGGGVLVLWFLLSVAILSRAFRPEKRHDSDEATA
jgi:hypothetical protein